MDRKIKVMSVFGTRPEAIKMCPLIARMQQEKTIENVICVTGQHRFMLDQVLHIFGIRPDYDLAIMQENQTLTDITTGILTGMENILQKETPDLILVHGDTTTSFAAALAAFYGQIPVGHVEAGLRTDNRYSPFPEEMNRQMVARLAELHFAATESNRENLLKEGVKNNIFVTGNTVIDAMKMTVKETYRFQEEILNSIDFRNHKVILLTAHRRENIDTPIHRICAAAKRLTEVYQDVQVIYPVHLNPAVRKTVFAMLDRQERIILTEPMNVEDVHNLLARCYLVMTDSGGLQEEAAALGKPVVVLRRETERTEAINMGAAVLGGNTEQEIFRVVSSLLCEKEQYQKMSWAKNPYGDGHACERIVSAILDWAEKKEGKA